MNNEGFDIIGDVHGMGVALINLLHRLGYAEEDGAFVHPHRRAVFVGDLIDRGAEQRLVLSTVRSMVAAGAALVVMGNHEFNALAFHTRSDGEYLREHSKKNVDQHTAFLEAFKSDPMAQTQTIEWFQTLPLWLDLDGLRVVHACWDHASMAALGADPVLTQDVVRLASTPGTSEFDAIETLLKGPEIPVEPHYHDKDGHHRDRARFAWWRAEPTLTNEIATEVPGAVTLHTDGVCPGTDGGPWKLAEPDAQVQYRPVGTYGADEPPVLFGHYWRGGLPGKLEAPNAACTDFSACKGGPLAAYRWSGEATLSSSNWAWVTTNA